MECWVTHTNTKTDGNGLGPIPPAGSSICADTGQRVGLAEQPREIREKPKNQVKPSITQSNPLKPSITLYNIV